MTTVKPDYVSRIDRHEFQSSSVQGASFLCLSPLTGMHTTLSIKTLFTAIDDAVVDFLYRFELPFSCYVDIHEIEVSKNLMLVVS